MIAEYVRAKILERGRRQAAKRGAVSVFSRAPYGYLYVRKGQAGTDARFEVVAEHAAVVRQVYEWFVRDRLAINAIARRLTSAGIPTPGGKSCWRASVLWQMLTNPAYQGTARFGRRRSGARRPPAMALWRGPSRSGTSTYWTNSDEQIEVPVPALVTTDIFASAQQQLQENRRRSRLGARGTRHLLQGLVICQQCGHSLVYHGSGPALKNGDRRGYYYRCTGLDSHRWGGERICDSRAVRAERLEEVVWQDIRLILSDPNRVEQEYARRLAEADAHGSRAGQPTEPLRRRVQQSISRLIDAYQEGMIVKQEFEPRLADARQRLATLERAAFESYTKSARCRPNKLRRPSPLIRPSRPSCKIIRNGNRTMAGYVTGTNNRLLADGTYAYEYDPEGNRTAREDLVTAARTEYAWDHRGRLARAVEKDALGAVVKDVEYTYDIFDRRIGKSVDADGAGPGSAVVKRFVYDEDHIALEFDGSIASDLTHRYLHGPVVDQVLADEVVTSLGSAGDVLWPLADNQGTVRDVVDETGTVLNHIKYDSFGKVTSETNAAVDFLFGYTGRERDEETGLYYYRARYYDSLTGQFISEDPKGFAAGDVNVSRYVGNSAVNLVDPSGLQPPWAHVLRGGSLVHRAPEPDGEPVPKRETGGWLGWLGNELYWYGNMLIGRRPGFDGKPEPYPWNPIRRWADDQAKIPLNPVPAEAIARVSEGDFRPAVEHVATDLLFRGGGKLFSPAPRLGVVPPKGLTHAPNRVGQAIDAALDATGKVHGKLPDVKDLGRYDVHELGRLRDELKQSVQKRIDVTVKKGADFGHNDRLAAEQQLIKSIEKHLQDR